MSLEEEIKKLRHEYMSNKDMTIKQYHSQIEQIYIRYDILPQVITYEKEYYTTKNRKKR